MSDTQEVLNSTSYEELPKPKPSVVKWIVVGGLAAASVVAGGLTAAWVCRKTLAKLQEAGESPEDTNFGSREGRIEDEF
jgi:hypothetical protein